MSDWRPISTLSPDHPGEVDLWVPREAGEPFGRIPNCYWSEWDNGWRCRFYPRFRFTNEPTHWMPAPEPPQD